MSPWLAAYLAGVAVALWRTDAAPLARIGLALVWPLGPAAAAATIPILLLAACILFPVVGVLVAAAAAAWWFLM